MTRRHMRLLVTVFALFAVLVLVAIPGRSISDAGSLNKAEGVLKGVLKNGYLRCGVGVPDIAGFIYHDEADQLVGFDLDLCKAVAVAVFGDETKVQYVIPADWNARFTLLQDGAADVLFAVATWTASRDSNLNVDFPATYYYDASGGAGIDALGAVVAHGDQEWADLVRWVVFGMITADELGVTSSNVMALVDNPPDDARVRNLLGLQNDLGLKLGLSNDFMVHVIKNIGNYGEVYARHLEAVQPRAGSLNASWTQGGILFAPFMQ